MSEVTTIICLTTIAGSCIPLGGLIASFQRIHPNWLEREFRYFLIAFGGGILLGAVAIVLVPEGINNMNHSLLSITIIIIGGLTFFLIERMLGLRRRGAPQLMGMILDYAPEALALGGLIATGAPTATLLAVLIGLQNLPEGFNSYRELIAQHKNTSRQTLLIMLALVALGPIAGLIGYFLLSTQPAILGGVMLFSSGGILYLIFQDIAPQSHLRKHWAPPLAAVFGFCLALFSEMLLTAS